jgi:hypothetical protein
VIIGSGVAIGEAGGVTREGDGGGVGFCTEKKNENKN